ncbi:MAG: dTDP-glucose 4,6-dehydratase [Anaerolineales bacterium]|jgi:dTDP-glucose 4,6-dehydratase
MRNVLVTGGAGFIGSNFIEYLFKVESEIQIINLDALTYSGNLENLADISNMDHYIFIHGNICNHELVLSLFRKYQIDTVVHFAAESHVDRSILNPKEFMETNVIGTFTLLESARQAWIEEGLSASSPQRFHHISTDEVFGSLKSDDPPFTESTLYCPNSPYAASKAASDHIVRSYGHTYNLPFTITNCSNNFGPYQHLEKLIPLAITNAVNGKKLPIYGDGMNIREWLYVEDHCEAIREVLKKGKDGETYLIGGNTQPTNLEVVETICDLLDRKLPESKHIPHRSLIEFVTDRPGHDFRYAMELEKINREIGWSPKHTFESGLEKTVDWYLANRDWIESVSKKSSYKDWMGKNYSSRGEFK